MCRRSHFILRTDWKGLTNSLRIQNSMPSRYKVKCYRTRTIVWSVKHFRPYLYRRKFKLVTDHRPLTWLFYIKDPCSGLARWRLKLKEYDYEIQYKPAKINKNADALSRIKINYLHEVCTFNKETQEPTTSQEQEN